MEVGECVFLAKGDLGSLQAACAASDTELQVYGQGKKATLHLIRSQKDADDSCPDILATVDRLLTNRDPQLPQNRRGVSNPAGQLQSVVAGGLADLQVVSVSANSPGVLAIRAAVRLLPTAFEATVPEHTSRAVAFLSNGAAAAAATSSLVSALLDVVEFMQDTRETRTAANPAEEQAMPGDPSTSTCVRKGTVGVVGGGAEGPALDGEEGEAHLYSDVRDEIFDIIAPRDWCATHPNPQGLKCKLFPYQQRALSWMVWRETQPELGRDPAQGAPAGGVAAAESVGYSSAAGIWDVDAEQVAAAATAAATAHLGDFASQDLFWRRVELSGGQALWVNPYPGGGLRREPPPPPPRQRVGILADEMGLGKTVEVIALMLARPPPYKQEQQRQRKGGNCSAEGGASLRPHGPNLIVTPPSILQQWSYELANHSNLKVYVYDGLKWHCHQSEEKEKQRQKEEKKQARLAKEREKEAKRQERARQLQERAAAKRERTERRLAKAAAPGQKRGRARRRGNDGQKIESDADTEDEDDDDDDDDDDHGGNRKEDAKGAGGTGGAGTSRTGADEAGPSGAGPGTSSGNAQDGGEQSSLGPALRPQQTTLPAGAAGQSAAGGAAAPRTRLRVKLASGVGGAGGDAGAGSGATEAGEPAHEAGPGAAGADARPAAGPSRMERYHRELMAALYAGTPLCPASCDPTAEAAVAVQELLDADVVLTTYTVLKEEVYYSPSNRVLSGLRYEKKYGVPESPLLQVQWHRLVVDEAQMVGGSYSNVVQMASRIEAAHRWCVTGTPIGAGGLHDIHGLLCVLKYKPYDDQNVFKQLIAQPYFSGSAEGHSRLAALVKPIMWRNSKAVAAQDHPLPRRVLQEAHLRFSAAEETFYDVILGETRKAFNEMTSHQRQKTLEARQLAQQQAQDEAQQKAQQQEQQRPAPQGGPKQVPQRDSDVIDLTADDDEHDHADGRSGGGSQSQAAGNAVVVAHQGASPPGKHHGAGKRRRHDRGEALAQIAGAELHQLRLACVHVQLTRYWQKLGQELALHGHGHHGAGGGAAALPAIDDVMARLRDQAQLHLQNAERDLCMVLNALASRLLATARRVKAVAVRRLLKEGAAAGGSAGQTAAAAVTAAAGVTVDDDAIEDDENDAIRSPEKPGQKKATSRGKDVRRKKRGLEGAADAEVQAGGLDDGADGQAESAVAAFRYNLSGKNSAVLFADFERMLRECNELLETSWNVGENGIEAAAQGAAAAAAAANGSDFEQEIKAANASIRSWRFVQANTSQLLADLLTTYPHLYAPAEPGSTATTGGATEAAGGSSGARGGAGPSSGSEAAAAVSRAAASAMNAGMPDASKATEPAVGPGTNAADASVRASELRAYIATRVTDVRATADRELQRARERLDRFNAAILRLKEQLVEEYELAMSRGFPPRLVPEPRAWLKDVIDRLDVAREVEAAQRAEQQAAAAAGATLALMGKEVTQLLSSEEAAVNRQRVGLDAVAGSLLVETALERLRAADRGLRGAHGSHAEPGPDWRSVPVGGVMLLLPPDGATFLPGDPYAAARAEWLMSYQPVVGLLRYAVWAATEVSPVEKLAEGIAHGFDQMTVLLCERHLRQPIRMLEARVQDQRKTADDHGISKLRGHGLAMLLPALEAVRLEIELLRTWKDRHTAELQVEVAEHQCEVVTAEVMAAAQGQVPGMTSLLRMSEEELRNQATQLKARCEELRHKKAFFQNQFTEASRLRQGGPSAAAAAGTSTVDAAAAGPSSGSAESARTRAEPQQQPRGPGISGTRPAAAVTGDHPGGPSAAADGIASGSESNGRAAAVAAGPILVSAGASGSAERRVQTAFPSAVATRSSLHGASTANVGVACRTGILACLHPWEQWRPSYTHNRQPVRTGSGGAPRDVLDLTGTDDMDIDSRGADPGAGRDSSSAPTAPLADALNAVRASGSDTGDEGVKKDALPAGEQREASEPAPPAPQSPAMAADAVTAMESEVVSDGAATAATGTVPGEVIPGAQAAAGGSDPAQDRATAAAAAARARMAAEMAAARARLGLVLGAEGAEAMEDDEGGLSCAVCAEPLKSDIRLFPCGHYYCAACSDTILCPGGSRRCPTCRTEIRDKDSVVKVGGISVPPAAGQAGAGGHRSRLRNRVGGGLFGSGEVDPPEGPHILSVKVEGASELMCKIGALMRRLVWLRDHRPAEKSLVFSQWSDALQIVERGLRTNNIGYVTLETGRKTRSAMSKFLNDDACRVFLLSLRQGAAGLTLVRANHVFLLEPSLDPAIEQQAVARVHRIGQTRDVTVTRLLVDGTVEEAVMRMLKEKQQLFMERGAWPAAAGAHGGPAGSHHSGAGPSSSGPPRAGGNGGAGLLPCGVPLLEGGEGEEASLPTAAPRQEVLAGADMSYLLNAVLL